MRGCVITTEVRITSVKAPVTYVFVYPRLLAVRKYKRQKAFCCNVQYGVDMLSVFSAEAKAFLHVVHY